MFPHKNSCFLTKTHISSQKVTETHYFLRETRCFLTEPHCFLTKAHRNSQKLTETHINQQKPTKTNRNPHKLIETHRTSPKPTEPHRNPQKLTKTHKKSHTLTIVPLDTTYYHNCFMFGLDLPMLGDVSSHRVMQSHAELCRVM